MSRKSEKWRNLKTPAMEKKRKKPKAVIHDHNYADIFESGDFAEQLEAKQLKTKFTYIRKLIKAKRYSEARYELIGIDHPQAHNWLAKLEKIDPQNKFSISDIRFRPVDFILMVFILGGFGVLTVMGFIPIESAVVLSFVFSSIILTFIWLMSRQ